MKAPDESDTATTQKVTRRILSLARLLGLPKQSFFFARFGCAVHRTRVESPRHLPRPLTEHRTLRK